MRRRSRLKSGRYGIRDDRSALDEIERVFKREYGRAVSVLVRLTGDIEVAEEAVQDAFVEAVERWPLDGLPPSPVGWVITTAKRRAIDRMRREVSRADREASAVRDWASASAPGTADDEWPDDRLRLIFDSGEPHRATPKHLFTQSIQRFPPQNAS